MEKAYKFDRHIGYTGVNSLSEAESLAKNHGGRIYGWSYFPKPYETQRHLCYFFAENGEEVATYYPQSGKIDGGLLLHMPPRIWAQSYKDTLKNWQTI